MALKQALKRIEELERRVAKLEHKRYSALTAITIPTKRSRRLKPRRVTTPSEWTF